MTVRKGAQGIIVAVLDHGGDLGCIVRLAEGSKLVRVTRTVLKTNYYYNMPGTGELVPVPVCVTYLPLRLVLLL
jgi:hypothetical protein